MDKKVRGAAIVPGSFDPITNGHINIVKRALESYDKVYLAVMINAEKRYTFSLEERRRIAEAALRGLEGVEVISSDGYLWKLAEELGVCAIVKGVRNETDREYEMKMARYNEERNPDAKTILLETEKGLEEVSSTLVREKLLAGEDISEYLPEAAIAEISAILAGRR
ncbi:MAG: pantetheine-phosphate adenylyltransferase [Clostridia bacterium]|nr:pantetheine-phosphate adenylyltransferase [Clostridia bacterium]